MLRLSHALLQHILIRGDPDRFLKQATEVGWTHIYMRGQIGDGKAIFQIRADMIVQTPPRGRQERPLSRIHEGRHFFLIRHHTEHQRLRHRLRKRMNRRCGGLQSPCDGCRQQVSKLVLRYKLSTQG